MPEHARRKVLYYCQSLVGIGHLTSSLRIIDELLPHCDVDLVYGGLDGGVVQPRPGFRSLRLATLLHDEDTGEFFSPEGQRSISDIWQHRAQSIAGFLGQPYHAVVLEFYPFGRRRFKHEIMAMLAAVREHGGAVPVFTSVREVLVPRAVENERRMVESVRKHIHTVFVRGDPALVRFDETFSLAPEIADRICYTGYISPPAPSVRPARKQQVLVSTGGGQVGGELLQAAIGAAPLMPEIDFLLAAGSRTTAAEIDAMQRTVRSSNVRIVPFLSDFQHQLMCSAVSISMGGDNTLLDVLNARTPALAYPYQGNSEQGTRIARFAEKGLLQALQPEDLEPSRLKDKINRALQMPYPARTVLMDGARTTSDRIRAVLG